MGSVGSEMSRGFLSPSESLDGMRGFSRCRPIGSVASSSLRFFCLALATLTSPRLDLAWQVSDVLLFRWL